ncbi:MAG: hypothetical protein QW794_01695 [Thermosphaera sp.]
MSQEQVPGQIQTQGEKFFEIEVPREKSSELYRFTDVYVYPSGFVTHVEYQRILRKWEYDVVSFVFYGMCRELEVIETTYPEEEECPFDHEKALSEVLDALYENERFRELSEELELVGTTETLDDGFVINGKVKVYFGLKIQPTRDYRIVLRVEVIEQ